MRLPRIRRWMAALVLAFAALACAGCEFVRNEFFYIDVPPPVAEPGPHAW